jgi:hypothetical protein
VIEIASRHQKQKDEDDPRPTGRAEFVDFDRLIEFKGISKENQCNQRPDSTFDKMGFGEVAQVCLQLRKPE